MPARLLALDGGELYVRLRAHRGGGGARATLNTVARVPGHLVRRRRRRAGWPTRSDGAAALLRARAPAQRQCRRAALTTCTSGSPRRRPSAPVSHEARGAPVDAGSDPRLPLARRRSRSAPGGRGRHVVAAGDARRGAAARLAVDGDGAEPRARPRRRSLACAPASTRSTPPSLLREAAGAASGRWAARAERALWGAAASAAPRRPARTSSDAARPWAPTRTGGAWARSSTSSTGSSPRGGDRRAAGGRLVSPARCPPARERPRLGLRPRCSYRWGATASRDPECGWTPTPPRVPPPPRPRAVLARAHQRRAGRPSSPPRVRIGGPPLPPGVFRPSSVTSTPRSRIARTAPTTVAIPTVGRDARCSPLAAERDTGSAVPSGRWNRLGGRQKRVGAGAAAPRVRVGFAGYRIEGLIDRGGMGVVYLATDPTSTARSP